jgi:hypothetical protein
MKGVELVARQTKPSAVNAVHEIVREHEGDEPH